jgi:hypothetical protein
MTGGKCITSVLARAGGKCVKMSQEGKQAVAWRDTVKIEVPSGQQDERASQAGEHGPKLVSNEYL